MSLVEVKCDWCKKLKRIYTWALEHESHHFCDRKCVNSWKSANMGGKNNPHWRGGISKHQQYCADCGKQISYSSKRCKSCVKKGKNNPGWNGGISQPSKCIDCGVQINSHYSKRCNKCKGKWQSENLVGENSPRWRGGFPKCIDCGKNLNYHDKKAQRCIKCYNKFKKGKNSPNWKGGITPIEGKIRDSIEYKQWRLQIFRRDEFTCYDCGQVGGELHAHHIKHFIELIQEAYQMFPLLPLYDAAMFYKPLWDVSNGKTLCKKCHKKYKKREVYKCIGVKAVRE